jgi:hypothetical protein
MRTVPALLKEAIGDELFEQVSKSPAAFAAAFDGELQPWEYQVEALEGAAELDPQIKLDAVKAEALKALHLEGAAEALEALKAETPPEPEPNPALIKFRHRWAIVSLPRQDGKSTLSAWYACWRFFTDETLELIISVALDRSSAAIILNEARRIISGNDILAGLVDSQWGMTKWSIRLVDGAEWMIRPSEAQFSRGYRPGLICFDELGFSGDDGELLQTLSAGQAAQERPQVFITSTVNLPTGPLWEMFERHRTGDSSVFLYYRQVNQSPKISKEYLDEQRNALPPSIYSREHLNTWSSGLDAFTDAEKLDVAMSGPSPLLHTFNGRAYCYVDLSWRKDESVAAVSRVTEEGKVEIIGLKVWTPTEGSDLDLEMVQEEIEELASNLGVRAIRVESPQGVMFSQTMEVSGATVESVHPTPQHQREVWGALYNGLRDERVRLPRDKKLRRQLLGLTIKSTQAGSWRVEEIDRKLHQDRALACAGAVWLATSGISKWVEMEFLAITPSSPVRGPNLTPMRRSEIKDHLPGVRRRSGALPVSGAEIVHDREDREVDSLSPQRRMRINQMARELLGQDTTLAEIPYILGKQFSMEARQIRRVLKELFGD